MVQGESFLDTTVKLEDGQLVTNLFVKPTDTHQYLAANSCHPRHCKEAIPYSQALRMRRICSSDESFNRRTTELKEHLVRRGYNPSQVQQQLERTRYTSARKMPSHPEPKPHKTEEHHWWSHTILTSHT